MNEQMHSQKQSGTGLDAILQSDQELRFAVGTIRKFVAFVVIALSAVGFHQVIEIFESYIPSTMARTLVIVTYAVFVVDVIWFMHVLVLEVFDSLAATFRGRRLIMIIVGVVLFGLGAILSPHLKTLLILALLWLSNKFGLHVVA
jgi:hypothetical protein